MRDECVPPETLGGAPKMPVDWYYDFDLFAEDVLRMGWKPSMMLVRIDSNGDYSRKNLMVCSKRVGRSDAVVVSAFGLTKPLSWFVANHPACLVRDYHVVYGRVRQLGWDPSRAMTTPSRTARPKPGRVTPSTLVVHNGLSQTVKRWHTELPSVVSATTAAKRIALGWSLETALVTPVRGTRPTRLSIPADVRPQYSRQLSMRRPEFPLA